MATMATTMATHLQAKTFTITNSSPKPPKKSTTTTTTTTPKPPISLHKSFTVQKPYSSTVAGAIAGAVFASISASDAAFAAQQIADIAEGGDNRGLALLIPLVPAVLWVLYNILQPALNQINRMRSVKGLVVGIGLAGASGFFATPNASAADVGSTTGDSRGLLLLFVVAPAILWVLYNILQPALNQINKMRSG